MKQKKLTHKIVKLKAQQFCACKDLNDLSSLLKVPKKNWMLFAFEPLYYHFSVPKSNGQLRYIEAPDRDLKKLQRKLNSYIQCIYYLNQSKASYGYIIKTVNSMNAKNIKTNALQHLGCCYLLNADFKNFFHQIKTEHIAQIFSSSPFQFNKHTAHTLAKICTYKGRLPMGAPTSPALSNFYTRPLDAEVTSWANNKQITYTRFVDDLSFSSKTLPINQTDFLEIKSISSKYQLYFGEDKTRFFTPDKTKIVTGLALNESIDIVPEFYDELQKDIQRLRSCEEVNVITGNQLKSTHLKKFKQEIMGKINFIAQIEGYQSTEYITALNKFYEAQNPKQELSIRWTKFGNYL